MHFRHGKNSKPVAYLATLEDEENGEELAAE